MVPTIIVMIINLISPFKNLLNMFIPPFHNRTCINRVYKKEEAHVGLTSLNIIYKVDRLLSSYAYKFSTPSVSLSISS